MPVSFFPAVPPRPPLPYPPPSAPAARHDIAITITDEDGFECAIELPTPTPEAAPPIQGLMAAIRSSGFMQAMDDLVAPHLQPGSPGRNALDQCGLFNVNQVAILNPPHKFGVQVNIVKPDIHPSTGNYYLQLFPVHNEIGFNLLDTLVASGLKDYLPDWCGLGTQLIFNHGVELPIVHTHTGWKLQGPDDGAMYLEEIVLRPTELALKYLASKYPGFPVQATFGLEVGTHCKWALNNPNAKWAFASTCAGNALGAAAGFAASCAGGGDPMLLAHGGAMLGQLAAHILQCWSDALCPDNVVTWAGVTVSAADVNTKHFMEYPRGWLHVHDGNWQLRDLKTQAEETIARLFKRAQQNRKIEMAEMGIDITDHTTQTHLQSISARYEAQQ